MKVKNNEENKGKVINLSVSALCFAAFDKSEAICQVYSLPLL